VQQASLLEQPQAHRTTQSKLAQLAIVLGQNLFNVAWQDM
jgi:hypothetical protein